MCASCGCNSRLFHRNQSLFLACGSHQGMANSTQQNSVELGNQPLFPPPTLSYSGSSLCVYVICSWLAHKFCTNTGSFHFPGTKGETKQRIQGAICSEGISLFKVHIFGEVIVPLTYFSLSLAIACKMLGHGKASLKTQSVVAKCS